MTAMLTPPVQMVRDVGWKQVLGLGQAEDGFWGRVRRLQLAQLYRNVPFNVGLLTVNLLLLIAGFGPRVTAMGVSFALDDFGTGYSALGTLQKANFSRIKIDRSFVARASAMGDEASAIIQAIVRLAASLDMQTTTEGTETRAAFELCRQLGCTQVQGYLFGKPMSPEEATRLVCEAVRA
ncbi:EAL domain-containing protein [Sandarakinorhabdus limnophila]|uniref:EAL domain-containing protein n=1 Tax=Sandarakinorhabdus limnophila TaxID=210512 RepID=UPI0026EF511B|nr:EAL domain-containing protein [Sandarakinorhabdus limnophila]